MTNHNNIRYNNNIDNYKGIVKLLKHIFVKYLIGIINLLTEKNHRFI